MIPSCTSVSKGATGVGLGGRKESTSPWVPFFGGWRTVFFSWDTDMLPAALRGPREDCFSSSSTNTKLVYKSVIQETTLGSRDMFGGDNLNEEKISGVIQISRGLNLGINFTRPWTKERHSRGDCERNEWSTIQEVTTRLRSPRQGKEDQACQVLLNKQRFYKWI